MRTSRGTRVEGVAIGIFAALRDFGGSRYLEDKKKRAEVRRRARALSWLAVLSRDMDKGHDETTYMNASDIITSQTLSECAQVDGRLHMTSVNNCYKSCQATNGQ